MDKELFPAYCVMCKKVFLLLQIVIVFVCRNVSVLLHIYGVPFVSKLTIQLMYILQVDVQSHGNDPIKQH